MQFTINKDYARRYNEYRRKEELQKLKDRHGDVKVTKTKDPISSDKLDDEIDADSSRELDSSDSSSDSDYEDGGSAEERDHEDFLRLYDALCRNDPSLDDPNKQWFHADDEERNESSESVAKLSPESASAELENTKRKKKPKDDKPVTLRDYERQFLLQHGGVEDEALAADADRIANLESDDVLNQLSHSAADDSKAKFLEASEAALRHTVENSNNDHSSDTQSRELDFLKRRKVPEVASNTKSPVDTENLRFTDGNATSEAETFLRDFIVNQRWKRPQERRLPTYDEVLRDANVDDKDDENEVQDAGDASPMDAFNKLNDDNILDEDDEFLIRVRDFERDQQTSSVSGAFKLSLSAQVAKHRFEEEDKEFIKSYPRKISTSMHQPTGQGRSVRSLKREARKARKLEQKQIKLAELARMRRLKLALLADKIERIKRSCGSGSDLLSCDLDKLKDQATLENDAGEADINKTALDLAEHLDEDWDPDKHDQLVERMFNEAYYQAENADAEIPRFSDASDLDSDLLSVDEEEPIHKRRKKQQHDTQQDIETHSKQSMDDAHDVEEDQIDDEESTENTASQKRTRRRLRGKARLRRALKRPKEPYDPTIDEDYEHYIDKHYKLTCEDVIPGPTPDEDLFCRFSYRQVTPNDYGLTTEEILTATPGELNSWAPINRITAYKTEEEEQRDLRVYHSNKKLDKKTRVIGSLNNPDAHWWPDESSTVSSKKSKKRKRSKKKRAKDAKRANLTEAAEIPFTSKSGSQLSETGNSSSTVPKKIKDASRIKKLKGIKISEARLAAANITQKDIYRHLKRHTDKNSQQPNPS